MATDVRRLVSEIADFLGRSEDEVLDLILDELVQPGIVVSEDWQRHCPESPAEIEKFYRETDSYIFHLCVDGLRAEVKSRIERTVEFFQEHGVKKVLDYGGGVGNYSIALSKAGMSVTYFDLPGKTSKFAQQLFEREGCSIEVVGGTAGLADGYYDAVVCIEVLEHLPNPVGAVREIRRLLKDGGYAAISASFGGWDEMPAHLVSNRRYDGLLVYILGREGFRLVRAFPKGILKFFQKVPMANQVQRLSFRTYVELIGLLALAKREASRRVRWL